jgi:hypothetical protein
MWAVVPTFTPAVLTDEWAEIVLSVHQMKAYKEQRNLVLNALNLELCGGKKSSHSHRFIPGK